MDDDLTVIKVQICSFKEKNIFKNSDSDWQCGKTFAKQMAAKQFTIKAHKHLLIDLTRLLP